MWDFGHIYNQTGHSHTHTNQKTIFREHEFIIHLRLRLSYIGRHPNETKT